MKKGTMHRITILDSRGDESSIVARFIGKGTFATCYEYNGIVYSFVKSGENETDYSKEAIAEFCNQNNHHVPSIEKVGTFDNGILLYSCTFYHPLTAKDKTAWIQAKILQSAKSEVTFNYQYRNMSCYEKNNAMIEIVRCQLSDELIEALESINSACSNYGSDYLFEFDKRNLAIDDNGNLILLDVIFNRDAIIEIRTNKQKKNNQY